MPSLPIPTQSQEADILLIHLSNVLLVCKSKESCLKDILKILEQFPNNLKSCIKPLLMGLNYISGNVTGNDRNEAIDILYVQILSILFMNSKVVNLMIQNKHLMAQMICQFLDIYSIDQELDVRLKSLKLLEIIVKSIGLDDLAMILPGILSTLVKVLVNSETKTHSLVVSCGLDMLELLIRFLFSLDLYNSGVSKDSKDSDKRNKEWTSELDARMYMIYPMLSKFSRHSHNRVKHSMMNLSRTICQSVLCKTFILSYECILFLSQDQDEQISDSCTSFLKTIIEKNLQKNVKIRFTQHLQSLCSFKEPLETVKLVSGYLKTFPMLVELCVDILIVPEFHLNLLESFALDVSRVSLVQDRISSTHLMDLHLLYVIIYFNNSFIKFYKKKNSIQPPKIVFKNLNESHVSIFESFFQFMSSLCNQTQFNSLVSTLFDLIENSKMHSQALWILSLLITGYSRKDLLNKQDRKMLKSLFKDLQTFSFQDLLSNSQEYELISCYHKAQFYDHVKDMSHTRTMDVIQQENIYALHLTTTDYHTNINNINLFMICISKLSGALQAGFQSCLMDALYILLERIADSNRSVSSTAWACLNEIASNMQIPNASVELLVSLHIDYIINSVSKRLGNLKIYPRAPKVLAASIRIAGIKRVELLNDCVLDILDLLDLYHNVSEPVIASLFEVFDAFVDIVSRSLPCLSLAPKSILQSEKKYISLNRFEGASSTMVQYYLSRKSIEKEMHGEDVQSPGNKEEIKEFFMNLHAKSRTPEVQDEPEAAEADEQQNEEEKEKLSSIQSMSLQILQKSRHFLAVHSPELRLYILKIIRKGLVIIRDLEKSRDPFIHQVWPILLDRLKDPQHYIVNESLLLIAHICQISNDFVYKRVSKDLVPIMVHILQSMISNLNDSSLNNEYYSKTLAFKNFTQSLETMHTLIYPMRLDKADTESLSKALIPFLKSGFAKEIHQFAVLILANLMNKDHGDFVWLELWIAMGGKQVIHSEFQSLQVPLWAQNTCPESFIKGCSEILGIDLPLNGWKECSVDGMTWIA